jgi:penicillin-binding protein 2
VSEYISNPDEAKELLPRYRLFYIAIGLTFVIFGVRLWLLQIIEGAELREFSDKNRIKQIKNTAPRGLMLDREGKILVENRPGFEAVLIPQYVEDLDDVAETLAPILETEKDKIVTKFEKSQKQNGPYSPVKLKENLTRDEVFRLKRIRLDTPGLEIRETVLRSYPLKGDGAQLFGYVGEISKKQIPLYNQIYKGLTFDQGDIIGKSGLEEVLEKEIRGQDGMQLVQVDAYGRETQTQTPNIYGEQIKDLDSVPGYTAVLTIDKTLQEVGYKFFAEEKRIGGVIAMRSDGEILAWFSTPSFDPNEFAAGITPQIWSTLVNDKFKPLRNKVIQDYASPGSTFKPYMAVTALQEKVITPTTIINCPGSIHFGKRDYHDSVRTGHGNITVYEALERSSNIFFYKMGIALGIDKMYAYISQFGIGQKTGVELPRETAGLMPNSAWKKQVMGEEWQPGENLSNAIGQGFVVVTPIQMAVGYNAIGTGGKVVRPYVIKKIIDNDGKVVRETKASVLRDLTQPQSNGIHVDPSTFEVVKEGMRRVVQGARGTAKIVNIPGADIAGKTGTTQVMGFAASDIYTLCEKRPIEQRHHGWFVAFAPADKPEIVVAALAEHACHGGPGAGPVVREIMKAYFEKYHPERIAEYLKKEKALKAKADATETIEGE